MHDGPNPELLERYGTDEVYFRNLEKRADTVFSQDMQSATAGEWGRVLTRKDEQSKVDMQRLHAQQLNIRFRQLEAQRMADVTENFGGPGTMRQSYTRRMQYQPYMLHPMMAGMAMQGVGPAGGMEVTASAYRAGAALAKMAYQNLPELPPVQQDGGGMMPKSLAAPHLQEAGHHAQKALGEAAMGLGYGFGEGSQALGQKTLRGVEALKEKTPGLVKKVVGVPGRMFNAFGRGVETIMRSDEVRPTVRWGTGIHPAANVNEYGIAIGGGGY